MRTEAKQVAAGVLGFSLIFGGGAVSLLDWLSRGDVVQRRIAEGWFERALTAVVSPYPLAMLIAMVGGFGLLFYALKADQPEKTPLQFSSRKPAEEQPLLREALNQDGSRDAILLLVSQLRSDGIGEDAVILDASRARSPR